LGKIIGSLLKFRSTSAIKPSFHLSRWTCHTPKYAVKIGTPHNTAVVGVNLKPDLDPEEDDDDEDEEEEGNVDMGRRERRLDGPP
jgi:hypothetical protein